MMMAKTPAHRRQWHLCIGDGDNTASSEAAACRWEEEAVWRGCDANATTSWRKWRGGGSRMDAWGGWCIIFVVETPSLGQAKISNNLQWSWGKSQLLMKWLNEWVAHVTKIASRQIIGSFWHGQCFSKLRNEKETFFLVQWSRIE
jgi:hypothetical protein